MKTPITDAAEKRSAHPQFIFIEDAHTLETAAQGLRDHLYGAPVLRLDESMDAFLERYKAWYRNMHPLVARFDALKEGK